MERHTRTTKHARGAVAGERSAPGAGGPKLALLAVALLPRHAG
jgi:hypothetical protein